MNTQRKPVRYTAFISHIEWFLYYLVIPKNIRFSNDSYFLNQVTLSEYCQKLQNAVSFLEILEFRNSKTIPISFQATLDLLRLPLLERDPYLSQEDRNKLMLLTITRIVNMICDIEDNSKLGRSIARILQSLNLKDYGLISEVRHTATHKVLTNIQVTQTAVQSLYEYLISSYWKKQFEACAPYLRENQSKVYSFIEKVSQEEPNIFQTNLTGWDEISVVLNSKKGKHKAKGSDKVGLDKGDKSKSTIKRAMRILDYLNKMTFHLKKFNLRQAYIQKNFEQDLAGLERLLKKSDKTLFQKYYFLQYRTKQILYLRQLSEEFDKIISLIDSKIPNYSKDLQIKGKKFDQNIEENLIQDGLNEAESGDSNKLPEGENSNNVNLSMQIKKMNEEIEETWMPEPIGKNYMFKMNL